MLVLVEGCGDVYCFSSRPRSSQFGCWFAGLTPVRPEVRECERTVLQDEIKFNDPHGDMEYER